MSITNVPLFNGRAAQNRKGMLGLREARLRLLQGAHHDRVSALCALDRVTRGS